MKKFLIRLLGGHTNGSVLGLVERFDLKSEFLGNKYSSLIKEQAELTQRQSTVVDQKNLVSEEIQELITFQEAIDTLKELDKAL